MDGCRTGELERIVSGWWRCLARTWVRNQTRSIEEDEDSIFFGGGVFGLFGETQQREMFILFSNSSEGEEKSLPTATETNEKSSLV